MKDRIKKLIKEYINNNNHVTFADIDKYLEENQINYKGKSGIWFNEAMKILAWGGMSITYKESVLELEKEKKINIHQCSEYVYLISGKIPKLPIAKNNYSYKKIHWLPCALN